MNAQDNSTDEQPLVVITGAHSGIGQQLIERLIRARVPVVGLVTPWCPQAGLYAVDGLVEYVPCDLRQAVPRDVIERCAKARILVHLAWVRPKHSADASRYNVTIYDHVRAALSTDVKTVYMSSVCATADNPSHYGQAKYRLSQHIGAANMVEILAGLVMSEPAFGPYLALQNFVCTLHAAFKFLPSPAALVAKPGQVMEALTSAVLQFDACPALVAAYDPAPVRLNDLIRKMLRDKGVWAVPVPVPLRLTLTVLYGVRKLVPGMAISDRLITLLSVNPASLQARVQAAKDMSA